MESSPQPHCGTPLLREISSVCVKKSQNKSKLFERKKSCKKKTRERESDIDIFFENFSGKMKFFLFKKSTFFYQIIFFDNLPPHRRYQDLRLASIVIAAAACPLSKLCHPWSMWSIQPIVSTSNRPFYFSSVSHAFCSHKPLSFVNPPAAAPHRLLCRCMGRCVA